MISSEIAVRTTKGRERYWKTCEKWLTKKNGFSHYKFSSVCKNQMVKVNKVQNEGFSKKRIGWITDKIQKSRSSFVKSPKVEFFCDVSWSLRDWSSILVMHCKQFYWDLDNLANLIKKRAEQHKWVFFWIFNLLHINNVWIIISRLFAGQVEKKEKELFSDFWFSDLNPSSTKV